MSEDPRLLLECPECGTLMRMNWEAQDIDNTELIITAGLYVRNENGRFLCKKCPKRPEKEE
jgi:hypothetical protein